MKKEDNENLKVVYVNKYKKKLRNYWPCVTGRHPWETPWPPSKDEDSPQNGGKEER